MVIALFWSFDLAFVLVVFSLGVMLPDIIRELGLTPAQAGLLGAANWLVVALVSLPYATFLSRYSPKRVVAVATVGSALCAWALGWAPAFAVLFAARFIFVGFAISRMQAYALLVRQWFPPHRFATINGLESTVFSTAQVISLAIVPLLLVWGWRNIYFGLAGFLVVVALLWMAFARERLTPQYQESLAGQRESPLRALGRHKRLFLVASCQMGGLVAWAAFATFWPTFMVKERGMTITAAGILMSLLPIGSVLGALSSGFIAHRLGVRRPLVWLAGLALPPLWLGLLWATSIPFLAVLLLLAGFFAFLPVPVIRTIPFEMKELTPREVAVAQGLMMTFNPWGGTVGPILVGSIYQATGSLQWGLAAAAPFALSLFFIGLFLPETGRRARLKPAPRAEESRQPAP